MGSNLLNGDLMGLTPLHADSRIQIVQLAGAQGNGLKRIAHNFINSKRDFFLMLPYSRACLFSGSQAFPVVPIA